MGRKKGADGASLMISSVLDNVNGEEHNSGDQTERKKNKSSPRLMSEQYFVKVQRSSLMSSFKGQTTPRKMRIDVILCPKFRQELEYGRTQEVVS